NPQGEIKKIINWINDQKGVVWSIDIPSGFNADSGKPLTPCVRATHTVSFEYPKKGFFNPYYKEFIGNLFIVEIGLNRARIKKYGVRDFALSTQSVKMLVDPRDKKAHKGSFQMVSVIGGSVGKMGAPLLAGMGAYRGGAGLVKVMMPDSALKKINQDQLELMFEPIDDEGCGYFKKKNAARVLNLLNEKKGLCVIGPGLGQKIETFEFIYEIIKNYRGPMVIDADALNALSKNRPILAKAVSSFIVLTPHPKEMERLSGVSYEKIKLVREDFLRSFCQKNKVRVLLKGAFSLYGNPEGLIWVNPTGDPSQANGGQGDFLSGLISGVIAERGVCDLSVLGAIFWHGLMANYLVINQNRRITLAHDLGQIADKALHWGLLNKYSYFKSLFP
ncbi:MAG: carbohydrate kinase, partial [uncultured bacterium]